MAQLWLIIGIALGALGVWLILRARLGELGETRTACTTAEREVATLTTTLEHERAASAEKLQLVEQAQAKLTDSFDALAAKALQSNNQAFVALAKSELAQHEIKAREVPRWRESDVFTPLERDVMEYAEAMSQTPLTVTDELSARLLAQLGAPALVELTAYVALANLYARSNIALGVTSQGFSAACDLKPLAIPAAA